MAKKETAQNPSRAKAAAGDEQRQDQLSALAADILCDYPDWPSEDLAALHLFKHEILSAAYRFYLNVSPRRGSLAVADILGKIVKAANKGG